MPEPIAITGIGTKFQRYNGTEWQDIARVFDINGPTMTRETPEATTYDSIDGYREFISGLRDPGDVTFTLNYRRSTYLVFKADFEDDEAKQYRIILPDTDQTTMTFTGLVTDLPSVVPVGDRITTDVTIKISGKVGTEDES